MNDNLLDIEFLIDKDRNDEAFNSPYKIFEIHKEQYDDRFIGSDYNWK